MYCIHVVTNIIKVQSIFCNNCCSVLYFDLVFEVFMFNFFVIRKLYIAGLSYETSDGMLFDTHEVKSTLSVLFGKAAKRVE